MACIDVGTVKNPFYFPAELCKIVENQPLKFEPPLSASSSAFKARVQKQGSKVTELPEPQDIFHMVQPEQFKLFFLRVTEDTTNGKSGLTRPSCIHGLVHEQEPRSPGHCHDLTE